MTQPGAGALGTVVVALAARMAEAWAAGRLDEATRLAAGAWRVVGEGTFVDCLTCDGPCQNCPRKGGSR